MGEMVGDQIANKAAKYFLKKEKIIIITSSGTELQAVLVLLLL
jgi:hypothetical protein